jgi:hypothetical protein
MLDIPITVNETMTDNEKPKDGGQNKKRGERKKKLPKPKKSVPLFEAMPFLADKFPHAHSTTKYDEWRNQTVGSLFEIPCLRTGVYEPYLALRVCHETPPFQRQFTGYGKNKVTWFLHLLRLGYNFQQVGGVFVVHFPHEESKSKQVWKRHPKALKNWYDNPATKNVTANLLDFKRGEVDRYFIEFRRWLEQEIPDETKLGRCENWADQDHRLWIEGARAQQKYT